MKEKSLFPEDSKNCSRRQFLNKITQAGVVSLVGSQALIQNGWAHPQSNPPRQPLPNPYVSDDGKPLLVVVTGTDFEKMLQTGLQAIGGLNKLIDNNQNVLINPNLNSCDTYPAISSADSIAILAKEVVKVTSGLVNVGDTGFHSPTEVYPFIHLDAALANTGASSIQFSGIFKVRQDFWDSTKPDFDVYSWPYFSPVIINFACIKRHQYAVMTGALKNNVGMISGSSATNSRRYLHNRSGNTFLKEIAEIAALLNPELTIIDARSMLIGNGPFSNSPGAQVAKNVNKLIISGDMVAVDSFCALLLQAFDNSFSVSRIESTLRRAQELGLGKTDLNEVALKEIDLTGVQSAQSRSIFHFELFPNYPNPFNSSTTIKFNLFKNNRVTLKIYNSVGKIVGTLIEREMVPGEYSIEFNADNLASGTYFYQLKAGHTMLMKAMTLLK